MKKEQLISQVAVLLLVALPAVLAKVGEAGSGKRVTKQVHTKGAVVESDSDHNTAETGFGAAGIGGHGKYFQDFYMIKSGPDQIEFGHVCEDPHEWEQRYEKKDLAKHRHQGQVATRSRRRGTSNRYQHNPEHDHYEFGYRRGNEHHFQERYEKAAPHAGHFKTKVRWGDKHGGYGEHYWDYNHAGHGGDGGDDGGSDGGYSEPVPQYHPAGGKVTAKRQSPEPEAPSKDDQRVKRQKNSDAPRLVFDVATGQVIDEATGQVFVLQPLN